MNAQRRNRVISLKIPAALNIHRGKRAHILNTRKYVELDAAKPQIENSICTKPMIRVRFVQDR